MSPAPDHEPEIARDNPVGTADVNDLRAVLPVFAHLDLADQLRELMSCAVAWTGGDAGLAFVLDGETRALVRAASTFPEDDPRQADLPRLDPARVWRSVGEDGALFEGFGPLADVGADAWRGEVPRSCLAYRVSPEAGHPIGLLLVLSPSTADDLARERVRRFLELARPAVANAVQVRSIRELVIKDDTAECFNRRYFEDFLVEELSRASRFRAALSLIFFDMDNLKEVNSRLGHAMGSRSLYEVSVRVRARIRKFDKLFRFGGDEFCIVLPETEWHGALEVAERVRESIATKPFLARGTATKGGMKMTASFGIASFPLHARTKEDLVQRADRAMQRIKSGTKNSIAIAEIVKEEHGS